MGREQRVRGSAGVQSSSLFPLHPHTEPYTHTKTNLPDRRCRDGKRTAFARSRKRTHIQTYRCGTGRRVTGDGLRGTGYEGRVTRDGLRGTGYEGRDGGSRLEREARTDGKAIIKRCACSEEQRSVTRQRGTEKGYEEIGLLELIAPKLGPSLVHAPKIALI